MSSWRHLFTVVTPTYNRAHTLERVYASLREQSFQDFEWVIVDDGSTDNTRAMVMSWQQEASFPIHYMWQRNQHKKTAFNRGVRKASGELVVALDSDDSLDTNALYTMARVWSDIPERERSRYVAITGLCAKPDGRIVGDMYPRDVFDATALDMTFKYHVKGEKFGCLRTDVLLQFPFPEEIAGFVPESLVWRAIARAGYLTRFVNQVFRVYHDSSDSLSRQGAESQQHALGLWLLAQDTVVECLPWFRYRPQAFLLAAARYTRFSLHLRHNRQGFPAGRKLKGLASRALVGLMWPAGAVLYMRDRLKAS
ncbi:glycosyltransferase family 2 protein [Parapusillimonas granuli]|uniref:Glycosyltransferase family 2 protein n=1 Tax=Parapusillimonas granuli TaxID=380911 RepID=A0A853G333_9BURK|nr:glycosyltransferase family A protein [Parapusillimonas granuli]MBB5215101.1 glycosyltransferase involved in cell wall biosynthesis [Parapusillimonas granuli]MEB2401408.1 glycosyltransferase family A protein [Alcaligenaceae bacterium]NYT49420.1 glycosyltransferase family 2 protein [Parapusillimonas granuli]